MKVIFTYFIIISAKFVLTEEMSNQYEDFDEGILAKRKQALLTTNVLKQYQGFSLMFHVENSTIYTIEYLLKILQEEMFGEVVIFNQDSQYDFNLKRDGFPFLHVVSLFNLQKFETYLDNITNSLISRDVVIFIIMEPGTMKDKSFYHLSKLGWAGNVLILDVSGPLISLYTVCYYCGEYRKQLYHLQTSNSSKIIVDKAQILPRKFNNFQTQRFEIGYINSMPYMLCKKVTDVKVDEDIVRKCDNAIGLEASILKVISKKLNFTYWLIESNQNLNKSEKDINAMRTRNLDFIIGAVSMTASRAPSLAFTSAIAFESYTFLYIPKKIFYFEFIDILKPFSIVVWFYVLIAFIIVPITFHICGRILGNNLKNDLPLSKCFKICFKSVIEQTEYVPLSLVHSHWTLCFIIIVWWFACLTFYTSYKSKLWAISIRNYHVEPSNLEELLNNDYKIVIDSQNKDIINDILNNNENIILQAKNKLVIRDRICSCIADIINNRAAMLDEYSIIQYHTLALCSEMLPQKTYSKLRITKTPLRHTTHSWPLQIGAPYKETFDTILAQIDSSGLKTKWKSDAISTLNQKYDNILLSQSSSTTCEDDCDWDFLQGFISCFILYILGISFSIICFIIEILVYRNYNIAVNKFDGA